MRKSLGIIAVSAFLAGCDGLPILKKAEAPEGGPAGVYSAELGEQRPVLRSEATIVSPDAPSGNLGTTIASLGDARRQGLWLETPLVATERAGRVAFGAKTVDVTLIPIEGPATAGSRISLQAMQALGAPITGLPELGVSAL